MVIKFPFVISNKTRRFLRYYLLKSSGHSIGKGTYISSKAYIDMHPPGKIIIGKNCNIARNAIILCHSGETKGGPQEVWKKYGGKRFYKDVFIGDNVFIGSNSVVFPGVKIGSNTIVGVNTVVNKNIPSGVVIAGVPFRVITTTKEMLQKKCNNFDEDDWNKNFGSK